MGGVIALFVLGTFFFALLAGFCVEVAVSMSMERANDCTKFCIKPIHYVNGEVKYGIYFLFWGLFWVRYNLGYYGIDCESQEKALKSMENLKKELYDSVGRRVHYIGSSIDKDANELTD